MSSTFSKLLNLAGNVTGILGKTHGGTGITSTATFPASGTIVTETATETLTNKDVSDATNTYRAASASQDGAVTTGTQTLAGAKTWNDNQTFKTGSGGTQVGSYSSGGWTIGTVNGSMLNDVWGGDGGANAGLRIVNSASASGTNIVGFKVQLVNEVSGNIFAAWATNNNGIIGSVSASGTTAVLYNLTSDGRLKSVVSEMTGAIDTMRRVRPVNFKWNSDGRLDNGFIAQEMQEVYPYAVSGEPNSDVKQSPMGMDYGRITPLLAAAIKELIKENDSLKARLDAAGF